MKRNYYNFFSLAHAVRLSKRASERANKQARSFKKFIIHIFIDRLME